MPTYDYRCLDCRKRLSMVQTYAEYGNTPVVCPHCGSANVKRLISRVRVLRSEDARLDSLADPDDEAKLAALVRRWCARENRKAVLIFDGGLPGGPCGGFGGSLSTVSCCTCGMRLVC